jgi:hypothetical protein
MLAEEKPKADGLLLMDIAISNKIDASKIFRTHFLFIDVPPMFGLLVGPLDRSLHTLLILSFVKAGQSLALGKLYDSEGAQPTPPYLYRLFTAFRIADGTACRRTSSGHS